MRIGATDNSGRGVSRRVTRRGVVSPWVVLSLLAGTMVSLARAQPEPRRAAEAPTAQPQDVRDLGEEQPAPAGAVENAPMGEPRLTPAPGVGDKPGVVGVEVVGPPLPPTMQERAAKAREEIAKQTAAIAGDEPEFPVRTFVVEYEREHPKLPVVEALLGRAVVNLQRVGAGYNATGDERSVPLSLAELNARGKDAPEAPKYSRRALASVLTGLRDAVAQEGILGVLVEADGEDLVIERGEGGLRWLDLREGERDELRVRVFVVTVTKVASAASGTRLRREVDLKDKLPLLDRLPSEMIYDTLNPPEDNASLIDHPAHEAIRAGSPVRPAVGEDATPENRVDLLRQDELDDYVLRLNRHLNRRVDVSVTGAEEPNQVVLQYLVRENNPLLLYAQLSNTGTQTTDVWRERVGVQHTQVTGRDDVFSMDYVTGTGKSHNLSASYALPLGDLTGPRARVFGSWSRFDASQVGQAGESFAGESWSAGGEITVNLLQRREWFLDFTAGARYEHISVRNNTVDIEGGDGFLLPGATLSFERATDASSTSLSLGVEGNVPSWGGTSEDEVVKLGRPNSDTSWAVLKFNAEQTFFLEPLLAPEAFAAGESTLAHEVALSVRGQHAFGRRLVPNFEQVTGGLYTARGYPESIAAGDSSVVFSAEYRLHIPRLLEVQPTPGELFGRPFKWGPQQPYGRPDWDLIARPFLDVAYTGVSDALSFESNETLIGAGIGLELMYRRTLNIRLDWGVALRSFGQEVRSGDSRLHLVATFLF